jgi:hypothetical protein
MLKLGLAKRMAKQNAVSRHDAPKLGTAPSGQYRVSFIFKI